MEFEGLNQHTEWEAKRVAAAFGIQGWNNIEVEPEESRRIRFCGRMAPGVLFECQIDEESGRFDYLVLAVGHKAICEVFQDSNAWHCTVLDDRYSETMARGLYRLGFEDENVCAMLNHRLSAHEQLELRLSLSREFWPKRWTNEESTVRQLNAPTNEGIE